MLRRGSQDGPGWKGLQWVSWCSLHARARPPQTWHRIVSRGFLNFPGDGDSSASLDNLFQCPVTHTVKKFMFR